MTLKLHKFYVVGIGVVLAVASLIYLSATVEVETERPAEPSSTAMPPLSHSAPAPGTPSGASESATAWMAASMQHDMFEGMDPETFAKTETLQTGHPSFAKAKLLLECKDFFDSLAVTDPENQKYSEAEQDNSDIKTQIFVNKVQKIRCKNVSPADYENVEKLILEAAKAGDPGALTYKAISVLARDENPTNGRTSTNGNAPASEDAKAAAKELLELAMAGNVAAISQAYEITATDRYGLQDPVASAAWKMVLAQNLVMHTFDPTQANGLPPDDMPRSQREQVVAKARAIFDTCCKAVH